MQPPENLLRLTALRPTLSRVALTLIAAFALMASAAPAHAADAETFTLDWQVFESTTPGRVAPAARVKASNRFVLSGRRPAPGVPQARAPQVVEGTLVVAGYDSEDRELSSSVVTDPRLVRAEFPDETGLLSGTVLYRSDAVLQVTVPTDLGITRIRVFEPQWAEGAMQLSELGTVAIP